MRCDAFALHLNLGDKVKILRSDRETVTEGTVVEFTGTVNDRSFRAPELPTFRIVFFDPVRGSDVTRWCSAHDIVDDTIDGGGFSISHR